MTARVANPSASPSAWAPFGRLPFAVLWIATVISNVGTWMHDVGAGWLMSELSSSPLMVAAVQAATTLPVFLLALVAGAVADIFDRRRLLIFANAAMGFAATALAVVVAVGLATPAVLLAFTFVLGAGAAFVAPAWQAIVPRLVPRKELAPAVALNSLGINISRAIGPALAGFLIVGLGIAAPFALNALSFLTIIGALLWWRPETGPVRKLPSESVFHAIRSGLLFALNAPPLQATLVRAVAFFVFASAFWAMLPLIAREILAGGPTLYGILLGAVGAGAVGGALVLPAFRRRLGPNGTVVGGTVGTALALATLAVVPVEGVAVAACVIAGISWIAVLSSLQVSAQTALPDWVRARGLSLYITSFFGSMAGGSLLWGQVAALTGISWSLLAAAVGILLALVLVRRVRLGQGEATDLSPSMHWPAPPLAFDPPIDRGPVMIQLEYRIGAHDRDRFLALMQDLRRARRRSGAQRWSLMEDGAEPGRFVETWFELSWLDHLRHHERVSAADAALQRDVAAVDVGPPTPRAAHFIAPGLETHHDKPIP